MGVATTISNHRHQKQKQQATGPLKSGWILDSFRKFALDSIGNVSSSMSKALKGRVPLHKTVHEELVNKTLLKPCNNKEKPSINSPEEEMQAKMEKMQEEMNIVKPTTAASSGNVKPILSKKPPPEQLKEKLLLMPNKNRTMIRSRL